MGGGAVLGGLAAFWVSEAFIEKMATVCPLTTVSWESPAACRPIKLDPAISMSTGDYLTAAVTSIASDQDFAVQALESNPAIALPPLPLELLPVAYPFGPPSFTDSARLQTVVTRLRDLAQTSEFPVEALSISLVDLTTGEYAGLHDRTLRYPASVIKPFWAIAALAHGETGPDIEAAITHSDNAASNRLLNSVGHPVMRDYWQTAGFSISAQYPVNVWVSDRPGNRVKTVDLVRLLHDIQSPQGHQRIAQAMWHDVETERHETVGAIHGFLGGGLPQGALLTKVGLTSRGRSEMAILTLDDRAYAIAIIGDDPTFARSESIFPAFGDLIFQLLLPPS